MESRYWDDGKQRSDAKSDLEEGVGSLGVAGSEIGCWPSSETGASGDFDAPSVVSWEMRICRVNRSRRENADPQ